LFLKLHHYLFVLTKEDALSTLLVYPLPLKAKSKLALRGEGPADSQKECYAKGQRLLLLRRVN